VDPLQHTCGGFIKSTFNIGGNPIKFWSCLLIGLRVYLIVMNIRLTFQPYIRGGLLETLLHPCESVNGKNSPHGCLVVLNICAMLVTTNSVLASS